MSNTFLSAANTKIDIDGTVIGDLDSIGTFGGSVEVIRHTPLNDGIVYKKMGSRDNGTLQMTGAYVPEDGGQIAMKSAFDGRSINTYTIELDNMPESGTNGTQFTFEGIVTAFTVAADNANSKVALNATVEITSTITITPAA